MFVGLVVVEVVGILKNGLGAGFGMVFVGFVVVEVVGLKDGVDSGCIVVLVCFVMGEVDCICKNIVDSGFGVMFVVFEKDILGYLLAFGLSGRSW